MKKLIFLLSLILIILGACNKASNAGGESSQAALEGSWKRPINGMPGKYEGLMFSADGGLGYINIYSMSGGQWQRDGKALSLSSLTERYPQPETEKMQISLLDAEQLVLAGEGFSAGKYSRDDNFGAMLSGQLKLPAGVKLPADALLTVQLDDVSLADAPSEMIGHRLIPLGGKSGDINWRVYYPPAKIQPRNRYVIAARITFDNRLQYTTTTSYPVLSPDLPDTVKIEVEAVASTARPATETMQGMYNYMADAGLFSPCGESASYPVATLGANAELERQYLTLGAGVNAKVLVNIQARLAEQTGMEGDTEETVLIVDKVISMDAEKSCKSSTQGVSLQDNEWQLIEVVNRDIPAAAELSRATITFSQDGKASGSNGCNRFNGSYSLNGSTLSFGPQMTTRRACPGDQSTLETAFNQIIGKVDGYKLSDDILHLLVNDAPVLRFAKKMEANTGLQGKWVLKHITGLALADDIKLPDVAYLEFNNEAKVSGKTGCNRVSTSYSVDGVGFKFGQAAATMMACPPDFMQIEAALHKAMANTARYKMTGGELIFNDRHDLETMSLQRP